MLDAVDAGDLVLLGDPEADRLLDGEADDVGERRRSRPGRRGRRRPGATAGRRRRRRRARRRRRWWPPRRRSRRRWCPRGRRRGGRRRRRASRRSRACTSGRRPGRRRTPAMAPTRIAPIGVTEEQDGVIATRPATTPDAAPSEVACPSRIFSVASQPSAAAPVATMRGHPDLGGLAVGRQRRAGVEAEPAEPQQAGADHDQRQVVRAHRVAAEAAALAEHQGERQARGTGVDVHRGATGEVDRLELVGDPAADLGLARRRRRRPSGRPGSRRSWPRCRRRPSTGRSGRGRRWRRRSARR